MGEAATTIDVMRNELPEVLTPEQAGELLQYHPKTVMRLAREGRIPGRKVGGQWRFSREALLAWLSGDELEPVNEPPNGSQG